MTLFYSPAKINLYLRVLSRRADGYHEIASLIQAVSLFDELSIKISDRDRFFCSDPLLAVDDRNLVIKALNLFRKKSSISSCFEISLIKKIPHEAGLGGGSSNAATTLWGINQLLGFPISTRDLQSWSAEIGSDIPFFFSLGIAHCTGRGEKVENLSATCNFQADSPMTLVKPAFGLSTPQVFARCSPVGDLDPDNYLEGVLEGTEERINDLEMAALQLAPQITDLKKEMALSLKRPMMTGSGSVFFGVGELKKPLVNASQFHQVKPVYRTVDDWY